MNSISNNNTRVQAEFKKELSGYYQQKGEKNGCPQEGTIYPPDIAPNDEVALQNRVEDPSSFLAKKGGLALHTSRAAQMSEYQDKYFGLDAREEDTLGAGLLLTDSVKDDEPWNGCSKEQAEMARKFITSLDSGFSTAGFTVLEHRWITNPKNQSSSDTSR
jgi:hypothetical protein